MSDNTQLDMFNTVDENDIPDEMSDPSDSYFSLYEIQYLRHWLREQYDIINNEQHFFEDLLIEGHLVDAAIYTLRMSNPPPLEQVMTVTGLGKTSIYNKLKLLRAIEKDRIPYLVYIGDHISEVSYGKRAHDQRTPDERRKAEQSAEEMWKREKNIK